MKRITKYQSNDGLEFKTGKEALARDQMIIFVDLAMSRLKSTPTDCNWKGYIQQDVAIVTIVKKELFEIANQDGVLKWWIDSQIDKHGKTKSDLILCHPSWFGRMLDGGHQPLSAAYHRLMCIDDGYREWNQPYFAANPGSGKILVLVDLKPPRERIGG